MILKNKRFAILQRIQTPVYHMQVRWTLSHFDLYTMPPEFPKALWQKTSHISQIGILYMYIYIRPNTQITGKLDASEHVGCDGQTASIQVKYQPVLIPVCHVLTFHHVLLASYPEMQGTRRPDELSHPFSVSGWYAKAHGPYVLSWCTRSSLTVVTDYGQLYVAGM